MHEWFLRVYTCTTKTIIVILIFILIHGYVNEIKMFAKLLKIVHANTNDQFLHKYD